MKTKNLSMVLGSLMALNSAGFMSAEAVTEEQKSTKRYSVESLLHNVDTKTVTHIGLGATGIGLLWALKEIVTSSRDNTTFKLNSIQQRIYDNTKILSDMILAYVENYITEHHKLPERILNNTNTEQKKILDLVKSLRQAWLDEYYNPDNERLTEDAKKSIFANEQVTIGKRKVNRVRLDIMALANLFDGLAVGKTHLVVATMPNAPAHCAEEEPFLRLLGELEYEYRWRLIKLYSQHPELLNV